MGSIAATPSISVAWASTDVASGDKRYACNPPVLAASGTQNRSPPARTNDGYERCALGCRNSALARIRPLPLVGNVTRTIVPTPTGWANASHSTTRPSEPGRINGSATNSERRRARCQLTSRPFPAKSCSGPPWSRPIAQISMTNAMRNRCRTADPAIRTAVTTASWLVGSRPLRVIATDVEFSNWRAFPRSRSRHICKGKSTPARYTRSRVRLNDPGVTLTMPRRRILLSPGRSANCSSMTPMTLEPS